MIVKKDGLPDNQKVPNSFPYEFENQIYSLYSAYISLTR